MAPLLLMRHTVGGWLKPSESGANWRLPSRSKYVFILSRIISPLRRSPVLSSLHFPIWGTSGRGTGSVHIPRRLLAHRSFCGFMRTMRKGSHHALRGGCHRRRTDRASRCASLALTDRRGQFAVRARVDHRDVWHVPPSLSLNFFLKALH